MDRADIQKRVDSFDRWHYEFDLDGVKTPIFDSRVVNRHQQRVRYFFDRLVDLMGGSLKGHRVLDLACNAGFWSLKAVEAGADFVYGVDGRQMHIDQANLVFEAKGVDPSRYCFDKGNVFEYPFGSDFDVVLCLGLMYHVSKPVELFELMARAGGQVLVIDTTLSLMGGSAFEVRREDISEYGTAVDYEMVLFPTRQAVIDLAAQFGYQTVPLRLNMASFTGMRDYRLHYRLAFICSKGQSIEHLPIEPPAVVRDQVLRLGTRAARRLLR